MDHTQELKHLSLCTGYGGIDLGLSRALGGALRTVTYVEIEAFCIENLVSKIESELLDVAPIFTDLKRFPWELYRRKVDIVSGGFPCQPFSGANQLRAGDDDPRHLFPDILDGLKRMGRPPLVFFENVEGIISSKLKGDRWSDPAGTSVLLHVLRELERSGYEATAGVFSAREIGAPHQRKRVFILGRRSDLGTSGRDLVSGLLERGGGEGLNLANPFNKDKRRYPLKQSQGLRAKSADRKTDRFKRPDSSTKLKNDTSAAYPAPRGRDQYSWEPPRVTREAEPAMGRDLDGAPGRVDYAELSRSVDNRTDELRMLGNGVVPDTAARAFRVLWGQLTNENDKG